MKKIKKKKIKVKKFNDGGYGGFDGTESLGNEGFGSVGLDGSTDTGPGGYSKDIGGTFTGDTGLGFFDNLGARTEEMGIMNVVPGAGVRNALMAARDTERMRQEMNMGPPVTPDTGISGSDGVEEIKPLPKLDLTPEEKNPFKKIKFVRASKGSMVSTRGTKSIQVQGHKKTKLY